MTRQPSSPRRASAHVVGLAAALVCGTAAADTTTVTVDVDPPQYDALQSVLDEEASLALSEGRYRRAWQLYWHMLVIDPLDLHALREVGRVAHAMGRVRYAAETLARVDKLDGEVADPELHYILGECRLALGDKDAGWRAFRQMEDEIGPKPTDRRHVLWLARVAALRGDLKRALDLYLPLRFGEDKTSAAYAEVTLYMVEAHILAHDWDSAEITVRDLLDAQPEHARAKEVLAWVLEGQDELDEELTIRAVLAEEWTEHPRKTFEYARALERAYDYDDALTRYREARSLGVVDASDGITRLRYKMAYELGAGATVRADPSGMVQGWNAGISIPFDGRIRAALTVADEQSSGGLYGMEDRLTSVTGAGILTVGRGETLGFGVTVQPDELPGRVGGTTILQTSPVRRVQFWARTDMNQPWRESASTIREGGVFDAGAFQLYASPFSRRVLFGLGGQYRRLGLANLEDRAAQWLGSAGVDVTLIGPGDALRGEILDGDLLLPRTMAAATVVSYRHYEMSSEDPFGDRLVLVERSSLDEVSAVARKVVDSRLGAEVRGGIGYDRAREIKQWRAGASLLLAATAGSRLTLEYDVASESGTGLAGRRHLASAVFHVDL